MSEKLLVHNVRKVINTGSMTTFLAWTTESGFPALARFYEDHGVYCGYVGVPKNHPLYGADHASPSKFLLAPLEETLGNRGILPVAFATDPEDYTAPGVVFDVHGSINYSRESCVHQGEVFPDKGVFPGYWWFGFDCGHAGDGRHASYYDRLKKDFPDMPSLPQPHIYETFRDLPYVALECESLACQLVYRVRDRNLLEFLLHLTSRFMAWVRS